MHPDFLALIHQAIDRIRGAYGTSGTLTPSRPRP